MFENHVKQRLRDGKTSVGCFLGLGSPAVAELLASAGFDWLIIETEHNAVDWADTENMIRAIRAPGTDTVPIVRVPSSDPQHIQKALDIGAMGVLVPMVKSAAEAEAVVRATQYPPDGTRGWGPLRASRYTFGNKEYYDEANDNILVILIVETAGAVDEIEEICAVPGVDALYMGFADLSLALGLNPFRLPHPDVDAVVERVLDAGKRHGVAIGNGSTAPDGLPALAEQGFRLIGFGPDYFIFVDAAKAGRAALPRD